MLSFYTNYVLALACLWKYTHSEDSDTASLESKSYSKPSFLSNTNNFPPITGKTIEDDVAGASAARPPSPLPKLGAIPKTCVTKRSHRHHRAMRHKRHAHHGESLEKDSRRETKKPINERENGIIDEEDTAPTHVVGILIPELQ